MFTSESVLFNGVTQDRSDTFRSSALGSVGELQKKTVRDARLVWDYRTVVANHWGPVEGLVFVSGTPTAEYITK